jgi:hypothetical protein
VVEAEVGFSRIILHCPILARSFQQSVSTDDVGLSEFRRTRNLAIDMALCGQVHDVIWLVFTHAAVDLIMITMSTPSNT